MLDNTTRSQPSRAGFCGVGSTEVVVVFIDVK